MSLAGRHVPIRSCVGCNGRDAQAHMARFTLVEGRPVWDREGRRRGRGAYLHLERRCLDAFLSRKPLLRSLRAEVPAPERVRLVAEQPLR